MAAIRRHNKSTPRPLPKCPTGISGLDEITGGGLPRGRPTLICGGAGCGKSLMSMEFLVRGITQFGEPGVLLTFEEPPRDVVQNVVSLGFDLDDLVARKKLVIDHVQVDRNDIEETTKPSARKYGATLRADWTRLPAKAAGLRPRSCANCPASS